MTVIGLGLKSADTTPLVALNASPTEKFLGRLLEYIPGDVVAGYVAVIALVATTDNSFTAEWVVAYVFLGVCALVLPATFAGKYRKMHNRFPPAVEYPWFRMIAAPVAYVAWVVALPNSPIFDWGTVPGYLQGLVLVVTTILLALAGGIWDTGPGELLESAGDETFADTAVED